MGAIDFFDFLEEGEWDTEVFADGDEGGDILRKTGSAIADAGIEEIATDAAVGTDAISHFFDVGPAGFTNAGDRVDVRNLEREEGIRRMLDEFRRVNVCHQNRG